jgi:hypothetical protein
MTAPVNLEYAPYVGRDRQYVSQFAMDYLVLGLHVAGELTDADDPPNVQIIAEETGDVIADRVSTREDVGLYNIQMSSGESSTPGYYIVRWDYALNGNAEAYETYIEVGRSAPNYDSLSPAFKAIVDSVWLRFADTFDSPEGGPNLMTYFQTYFTRNRLAEPLLTIAMGRLNTMAQPMTTYTIDAVGGAAFPLDKWGPLLETALYIETLKHLVRSYVEQPQFIGGQVTRLDRRDYMDRWNAVLRDEEDMFRQQLQTFKIAHMGLGRGRVLASGGVYGRYGPTRITGSAAARPRYWARWY